MVLILSSVTSTTIKLRTGLRSIAHLLHNKAKILYSSNGLYAVDKPVDILSHPNKPDDVQRSVVCGQYNTNEEKFECQVPTSSGGKETVYLINRLDSATSGIILMTTDAAVAKIIKKLFVERKIVKTYKAIVFCDRKIESSERSNLWEDAMQVQKIRGSNRAIKCDISSPSAMFAVTDATIADPKLYSLGSDRKNAKDLMLVELKPKTGYTHQLRHQCALHEMPIVGDKTYGNFKKNRAFEAASKAYSTPVDTEINQSADTLDTDVQEIHKIKNINSKRMMLHSYSIQFSYDHNDIKHDFKAVSKLPTEFKIILDYSYNAS